MTNVDARLIYENAKSALRKAFPAVPNIAEICKLTQSTIRLEQPMKAGNTVYHFPVLVNESQFSETEVRLKQQDSAVIYQIGMFVAKPANATDTDFKLSTYPDETIFTNVAPMESLYNGQLSFTVNGDVLLPDWDLFKHKNVPEFQKSADPADLAKRQTEIRGAFDGFYPMEPNIVLIGSKNNIIRVNVPGGITTVDANSRIVLILRSILAQNSTVVS